MGYQLNPLKSLVTITILLTTFSWLWPDVLYLNYVIIIFSLQLFKGFEIWRLGIDGKSRGYYSTKFILIVGVVVSLYVQGVLLGNKQFDILRDYTGVMIVLFSYDAFRYFLKEPNKNNYLRLYIIQNTKYIGVLVIGISVWGMIVGIGRYELRGEYFPFGINWLLMGLALQLGETVGMNISPSSGKNRGLILLTISLLLSFSRTDIIGLIILMVVCQALFGQGYWYLRFLKTLLLVMVSSVLLIIVIQYTQFGPMLNPINDSGEDLSIGWRMLENTTLIDTAFSWDWPKLLFGEGMGSRLALPFGVLDFNNNNSIPFLHNSLLTCFMKYGFVGVLFIICILLRKVWISMIFLPRHGNRNAVGGGLIIIVVFLRSMTLHGLSEGGSLMWLALAIAIIDSTLSKYKSNQPQMNQLL